METTQINLSPPPPSQTRTDSQFLHRSMQLFHKDRWIKITIYFCWIFRTCCCCLLSSVAEIAKRGGMTERERESHILFVFNWMIFMAAFFRSVAAAASVSIEQQFVVEQSTFRSHFVSKTQCIMELNVERIGENGDGDWCARSSQWQGQTTHWQRDGGLTFHSKSNRLFWIIDKLSLWIMALISGDIVDYSTQCVCVLRGFRFEARFKTNAHSKLRRFNTRIKMDCVFLDSLDYMNLIWFVLSWNCKFISEAGAPSAKVTKKNMSKVWAIIWCEWNEYYADDNDGMWNQTKSQDVDLWHQAAVRLPHFMKQSISLFVCLFVFFLCVF